MPIRRHQVLSVLQGPRHPGDAALEPTNPQPRMPIKDAERLDMPAVTSVMLEELDARIAEGLGHELPVPFYYSLRGNVQRDEL